MAVAVRTRLIAIVAVALTVLAVAGVGVVRAADAPSLPPVTPDRLLASTAQALSQPVTISGDVETFADLGLPQIPSELGGEGGPIALVNGTQRFRVWHSPDGLRIAHVLQVSERDLVVNRDEAWWWDSSGMKAVRLRFVDLASEVDAPPGANGWMRGDDTAGAAMAAEADPLTAARAAIHAVAPYASVSVEGAAEVAGRAAYRLVLRPATDGTLVDSIVLSIDAESRLPLRVEVVSRTTGSTALSAGFTSVSFDPIDPAVFTFTPPEGAQVTDALDAADDPSLPTGHDAPSGLAPRTFGSGFETRVAVAIDGQVPSTVDQLLPYSGPLLSATIVRSADGTQWLLVGSVPLDVLQADVDRLP
jgi:outer membrane lipoprotein-sorting protein